jgi:hypothetical protein
VTRAKGVGAWLAGDSDYEPYPHRPKMIDVDMGINRHCGYDSPESWIRRLGIVVIPFWPESGSSPASSVGRSSLPSY